MPALLSVQGRSTPPGDTDKVKSSYSQY